MLEKLKNRIFSWTWYFDLTGYVKPTETQTQSSGCIMDGERIYLSKEVETKDSDTDNKKEARQDPSRRGSDERRNTNAQFTKAVRDARNNRRRSADDSTGRKDE